LNPANAPLPQDQPAAASWIAPPQTSGWKFEEKDIFTRREEMKKQHLIPVIILVVMGSIALLGCQGQKPSTATPQPTSGPVKASDRIVSEGSVLPVQYTNLSFSGQGVLEEVQAKEGNKIKKDQAIARLKGSAQLQASLAATQMELLSAQQTLDELKKNADVAKAAAQLKLAQASKDLDKAKTDMDSKSYKRADQSVIDNSYAQMLLSEDVYKKAQDMWSNFAGKDETDLNRAYAQTQLSKARYDYERAKANYNYANGLPDQFDVSIAEGKLSVAQTAYDQANRDWLKVKDGPDPEQLALLEARLANAKAQMAATQSALDDQELKAPFEGTIVASDLKVGQLIGPQTTPVLLADLSNFEIITTDLTELNVVSIHENSPVIVTFDAIPGLELTGKVTRVKALGEDKQGDVTYTVHVQLDKQDPRLRWNMTASVVFGSN
jgi:HlyD family secretion protein